MTDKHYIAHARPLQRLLKSVQTPLSNRDVALLTLALMALHKALDGKFPLVSEVPSSMDATFPEISCKEAGEAASALCRQAGELVLSQLMAHLDELLRQGDHALLDVDSLMATLDDGSHGTEVELPQEMLELMLEALPIPHVGASIYLPWDEAGQFLEKAGTHRLVPRMEILDPRNLAMLQLIGYVNNGEADTTPQVICSDPIKHPSFVRSGQPLRFDACIATPPIASAIEADLSIHDLYNRFPVAGTQYHQLAIQHVLWQTKGPVAVLTSHSTLFGSGSDRQLREHLLRNGMLRAVIGLPGGLLSRTQIPLAILLLNTEQTTDEVLLLNADHPDFIEEGTRQRKRLINTDAMASVVNGFAHHAAARRIRTEDLLHGDSNLVPSRHILSEQASRAAALVEQMPTRALRELSTIIRPALMKVKEGEETTSVYEISVADLTDAGYIDPPSKTIRISEHEEGKIAVRPGDVLLSIKGANRKVGLVPWEADGETSWVVGQSLCIIRCDASRLKPKVLTMLLRSPLGQQLVEQITTVSTIPFVQLKELRNLQVPVPDPVEQQRIEALFDQQFALVEEIRAIKSRIGNLVPERWNL